MLLMFSIIRINITKIIKNRFITPVVVCRYLQDQVPGQILKNLKKGKGFSEKTFIIKCIQGGIRHIFVNKNPIPINSKFQDSRSSSR